MALRILLFGIGLLVGYASRRRSLRRGARAPSLPLAVAGGCVLLLASWAAWQLVASLLFLPRSLLAYAPLDALVVGLSAGWILADHQVDAEQVMAADADARPGGTEGGDATPGAAKAPPSPSKGAPSAPRAHEPAKPGLEWLVPLTSAARTTVTSLGLLILSLLGVAPPQFWDQVFNRLEGVKAAGLEITLGTVAGQDVAQSISASTKATEVLGPTSREERHGFIDQRLERIRTLTHPHDLRKTHETSLVSDPTLLLYVQAEVSNPEEEGASDRGAAPSTSKAAESVLPPPRDVARDRALLLHLHLGTEATDTRRRRPPPGQLDEPAAELGRLGKVQEQFLARLATHVACIREIVKETSDRRLLEYQTARVVEELYLLTRLWSSLEKAHTRHYLSLLRSGPPGTDETAKRAQDASRGEIRRAEAELRYHANRFSQRLYEFAWWADNTILVWRAARPEGGRLSPVPLSPGDTIVPHAEYNGRRMHSPATPVIAGTVAGQPADGSPATSGGGSPNRPTWARPERPREGPRASRHCDSREDNVRAPENYIVSIFAAATHAGGRGRSEFEEGGFTPYLTIFVAQALSAMGDHTAALRMLVAWQKDLNELVAVAKGEASVSPDTRRWAKALPGESGRARQIESFLLAAEWFELTTFVETLIVQNLSEGTEFALPPTEEGALHAVTRLFPAVFARISQDTSLREWRAATILECRKPTNAWRQALVLSYASLVKNYLDIRNKNLIQPDDITSADLGLADILEHLNLECFPDQLEAKDFPRQRAAFSLTAAAIKLNLLVTNRISSDRKQELRQSLQSSAQRTMRELERSKTKAEGTSDLDHLVFARDDELLNSAKSIKARLDTFARR